ncbi:hypothetical protein [Calidifontibacillus oryziterrae]|uniref:hypothetical protein n=1 Tax=Calidifontibacillus oryziterrae TaxID=1191699 RepID=UPI0002F65CB0|nr:hypothetical protein [Calidifontibacillus oryziterrae]
MFSQYFGHYLLNKGLISADQLKNALDLQASTHVKLGVLSVNEGFMTASQVEEVHEKQKQVDKRFGEIAIELGYLTEQQLDQLLSGQKQNHLILGQALVDRGYMSIEQFSDALAAYKKDNSLSDEQFEAIKDGDIDTLVEALLQIKDSANKQHYTDYVSLFAKNLIRFIDDQVRIEAKAISGNYHSQWWTSQNIIGENGFATAIGCDEDVFVKFASIYAEETLEEVDELAQASVSEFLNLHNGIYTVNMSNRGIEYEMDAPKVQQNVDIAPENSVLIITAYLSFGTIDIIITN